MPARRNTLYSGNSRIGSGSYNYGATAKAYSIKKEPEEASVIKLEESGTVHRVAIVCVAVFAAALMIVFLCSFGYNYELTLEISDLQEELNELKEDNYYLESDFDNNLNLEYIEKIAIERLGMQKPTSYQIRYINVPKQSYTILYDETKQKKGFIEYLREGDLSSALGTLFGREE